MGPLPMSSILSLAGDGYIGLVECVQLFHCKKVKWTQISGTVVDLQVVLRFEFVMVVLSKQNLSNGSV